VTQQPYIKQLNPGYNHTLLLKGDGTVWAWGANDSGELGNGIVGPTSYSTVPTQVGLPGPMMLVGGGAYFSWSLAADGVSVYEWGENTYGELGLGYSGADVGFPVQAQVNLPAGVTIVSIANTFNTMLALLSNGQVMAWGANQYGQCGLDPNTYGTNIYTPTIIPGLSGVTQIAAGDYYAIALKADGSLYAWGQNDAGQLGPNGPVNSYSATPILVTGIPPIQQIAAGGRDPIVLDYNNNVWEWGRDQFGELGNGTTDPNDNPHPIPAMVQGLPPIVSIDGSGPSTIAADAQGDVYVWGYNKFGAVGNGTTVNQPTPYLALTLPTSPNGTVPSVQVATGHWTSYAYNVVTGEVYTWGQDTWGETTTPVTSNPANPLPINITSTILGTTATPPTISGNVQEGQTLTASATTGTDGGTISYQWFSSADGYTNPIGSGTTYVVRPTDIGARLEVVATITRGDGTLVSLAGPLTAAVPDDGPTVSTPAVLGIAQEGQTLTASATIGGSATSVSFQWFSSIDGYTNPIGSGATYVVQQADEGSHLEVVATATDNDGLSVSQTSTPTAAVAEDPSATIAVASVSTSPVSGIFDAGNTILFTLKMTDEAAVTGTPFLKLNDGGKAYYQSGSGTATLTFAYTVAAGENIAALAISSTNLNGGTVTNAAKSSNTGSLSGAVGSLPGSLQIDTKAPTVSKLATSLSGVTIGLGASVTLTATMSETVYVSGGTPTLALNDGGTATYLSGSGTGTLNFLYTVGAGQNTPDLTVTGFAPNGATIADAAGNAADMTGIVTNPTKVLGIDTQSPVVTGVTTSPAYGDGQVGNPIKLSVTFNEVVQVAGGTPSLALNSGGKATYASGSGTSTLVFNYVVAAGDNTPDLGTAASNALQLNGATITDKYGNPADLTGANNNSPPGIIIVDTSRTRYQVNSGTGQTVTSPGNGNVFVKVGTETLNFQGTNNIAFLGNGTGTAVNATINDQSSGLQVYVLNPGNDVFNNIAADPGAVINLLGGIGGYSTVSQVMAALTADGHGGTLLPLGAGASIDFANTAAASLLASNFKLT
jgi:alpha-tubulin suppressor-like RCC1 family protein